MRVPLHAAILLAGCVVGPADTAAGGRDMGEPRPDAAPSAPAADAAVPDASVPPATDPDDPALPGMYAFGRRTETFTYTADDGQERAVETVIWYPTVGGALAAPEAALPLVIFSHGCGGLPTQYTYLSEHLASYGFVVAGPIHPGNSLRDCAGCNCGTDGLFARPADIVAVRDALVAESGTAGSFWYGALDGARTAVAGHSNGAWATMAVALAGDGFVAAMPLGLLIGINLPDTPASMPVLMMHADVDEAPDLPQREFGRLMSPRFYVNLFHAAHHSFTDEDAYPHLAADKIPLGEAHRRVNRLATAFLMRYVAGDDRYASHLASARDAQMEVTADP